MIKLVIDSSVAEIRRVTQAVEEFRVHHGLAQREGDAVNVVLDEVLSNSIRHGLRGEASHPISVSLDYDDGLVTVTVEDGGIAFDPTSVPAPALAGSLAERKAGGLGLAFVRSLTDSIEYKRVGERNLLVMRRRVGKGESPSTRAAAL